VFPDPLVQAILIVKESLLDQADTATYCIALVQYIAEPVSPLHSLKDMAE
jgi:hypothetical protein